MFILSFQEKIWNEKLLQYLCEHATHLTFRISLNEMEGKIPKWSFESSPFWEKMRDSLIMDFTDTVYFDSEFNELNKILVYKIDRKNIQCIKKYFPLMQFDSSGTPEDPCFTRENGSCLLKTVFHEEICWIYDAGLQERKALDSIGLEIESYVNTSDIPRIADKVQIEKRVACRRELSIKEFQCKMQIENRMASKLIEIGFCRVGDIFYRIIKNAVIVMISFDGQDSGDIYYDVLPLCIPTGTEEVLFPGFSIRTFTEEAGIAEVTLWALFEKEILPLILDVETFTSFYQVRTALLESHGLEEWDDEGLIYALIKNGSFQEASQRIQAIYKQYTEILDEECTEGNLSKEERNEELNHFENQFSQQLNLCYLIEKQRVEDITRILSDNERHNVDILEHYEQQVNRNRLE